MASHPTHKNPSQSDDSSGVRNIPIPLVDLVENYKAIKEEIDEAISSTIEKGRFVGGLRIQAFATAFADYCDVPHSIPCANGTDALEIALSVLGIGKGDEVIIPAFTFVATLEAVVNVGATPVLCDVDPLRYTIDVEKAKRLVTSKTKAIIPVHLFGQMADMDALQKLTSDYNIRLIEDAAQAHGATYKGKKAGGFGDISTFSFFPGKNLGAFGDAGAITTLNEALSIKALKMANHGRISKYDHETVGRNSRMDTIQAAILLAKLRHLTAWNNKRAALAIRYHMLLNAVDGLTLPKVFEDSQSAHHLFVVRVKDGLRDDFRKHLKNSGIETGIHYPIALSQLKVTTDQLGINTSCPISELASREVVSLPIYPELGESKQDYVCAQIIDFFK